jgi:thimet oligopeptidase
LHSIKSVNDVKQLFSYDLHDIQDRFNRAEPSLKADVEQMLAIPDDQRTYDTTFGALERAGFSFSCVIAPLYVLSYVHPDGALRDLCQKSYLHAFGVMQDCLGQNIHVYQACKAYFDGNYQQEKNNLSEEQNKLVADSMRDFKRLGFELDADKQERVKELVKDIENLSTEYEAAIARDCKTIALSSDQLRGVQESFFAGRKTTADGLFLVGADYPTFFAVMENCEVAQTRRDLLRLKENRAYPENMRLLDRMIEQMDEYAHLVGYKTAADYELEINMAQNVGAVKNFLDGLVPYAKAKQKLEFEELVKELPASVQLTADGNIQPWDLGFVKEAYKKKRFNLSSSKVAEYFPVDHVLEQVLTIYQDFLGLQFVQERADGLWDPSVQLMSVYKKEDHQLLGFLLLDLYPREGKYSHACHVGFVDGYTRFDGTIAPSASLLITNFPKPIDDKPALFTYKDVKTFFHEFGHAMHSLLSKPQTLRYSGTNVKSDFVEVPSQMFECWMTDVQILKRMSKHYVTGEPLPKEYADALSKMQQFDAGDFLLRQIALAKIALEYYSSGPSVDTQEVFKKHFLQMTPYRAWDDECHMQASFGHIVSSLYRSRYYNYLWAEMFSMDLFEHIRQRDYSSEIGKQVAEKILQPGGSIEPMVMLEKFLGRKPNNQAFLKMHGLI